MYSELIATCLGVPKMCQWGGNQRPIGRSIVIRDKSHWSAMTCHRFHSGPGETAGEGAAGRIRRLPRRKR